INRLLEAILTAAKTITRADGGTLYRVTEDQALRFEIVRTSSLKYYLGGTTGNPVPFYPIQLHKDGKPNHGMVAAYAALTGKTVNIADAYSTDGFDFSGTRAFDQKTGYRSKSFLTVPMRNHDHETIYDRIHLIDTRFEVLKRDVESDALKNNLGEREVRAKLRQLEEDCKFLHACNIGGERMREEDIERVRRIGRYRWRDMAGHDVSLLTEDELKNLTIRAGTLTEDERKIIHHHIVATIKMLEALPWPKHLANVPEY